MNEPFAEVIQSSLTSCLIECWKWNQIPEFGSLVMIKTYKKIYFGIVTMVKLGSSDPSRQPYAYQKTEEELLAEQPQIFEFLQTVCTYLPVGFLDQETIYYQLPPKPPTIHSFVYEATSQDYKQFFSTELYLPLLLQQQEIHHEELLLALLRKRAEHRALTQKSLLSCIDLFAYYCNDYRKLRLFLQRIESLREYTLPSPTEELNVFTS